MIYIIRVNEKYPEEGCSSDSIYGIYTDIEKASEAFAQCIEEIEENKDAIAWVKVASSPVGKFDEHVLGVWESPKLKESLDV